MSTPIDERVAAEVRAAMARSRERQSDVATATGISQPSLSRRLAAKASFTVDELERLARHFGLTIGAFVEPAVA